MLRLGGIGLGVFLCVSLALADIIPEPGFDPNRPPRLAVPELASTQGFEYFKNVQCIKIDVHPEIIPVSQGPYKPISSANFVSYQVCDRYEPLPTRDARGKYHRCTQCRPLLPELATLLEQSKVALDTPYYFDVGDIHAHSLTLGRKVQAAQLFTDVAMAFSLFHGVSVGMMRYFGVFTARQFSEEVAKAFLMKDPSLGMLRARTLAETLRLGLNAQTGQTITRYAGGKQFVAGVIVTEVEHDVRGDLLSQQNSIAEVQADGASARLWDSLGSLMAHDTRVSLKRYTQFVDWNGVGDRMIRYDDFRLVTQGECQTMCEGEFQKIVEESIFQKKLGYFYPGGKYADAFDFHSSTVLGGASEWDKRKIIDEISPMAIARVNDCKKLCQQDCMQAFGPLPPQENASRYAGKSPQEKALAYLLEVDVSGPPYTQYTHANAANECAIFPEYKELSLPEVALLWASLLRHAFPRDNMHTYGQLYPSEAYKTLACNSQSTEECQGVKTVPFPLALGAWEALLKDYPTVLVNPYQKQSVSSRGMSVSNAEPKKTFYVSQAVRDCPQNCQEKYWDFIEECQSYRSQLKDQPFEDLTSCQQASIKNCAQGRLEACVKGCPDR